MSINDDLFHTLYVESTRTRPQAGAMGHSQFTRGAEWGAGWAFAIIGMAQAIRDRGLCDFCESQATIVERRRRYCRSCWLSGE